MKNLASTYACPTYFPLVNHGHDLAVLILCVGAHCYGSCLLIEAVRWILLILSAVVNTQLVL